MKVLLFVLLLFSPLFSVHSYAKTLYHPNDEQSLFSLTKTYRQTERGIELVLTLKNTTDEINGNGLEKIVEGIEIQYPLPPNEWFMLSDSHVSRGSIELRDQELAMCAPTMLGRLKGFEKDNDSLNNELTLYFENNILPRMKPTLSYWLVGHTDTKGRASYNKKLSLNRAETVKQVLANANFETRHITAFGEGENSPLTLEQDEVSHQLNRRVEIYPKQHPRIYWQLSEFKPDDVEELTLTLEPNTWANAEELKTVLFNDSCYQLSMSHQYTIPTHAKLQLHSHIKPLDKDWMQTADVSSCDSVNVELKIDNHGARSATKMHLINKLPQDWQLNYTQNFKQRRDEESLYLEWEQQYLYPNKSLKLQYNIQPPFLTTKSKSSDSTHKFCLEEHDNSLFDVGCLIAKQLQENAKPKVVTQKNQVTLTAKGYDTVQAKNTIRWHTPSLILQSIGPQIQYAGEKIEQTLIITNNGNVPIKKLKVVAQLPKNIRSLEALHTQEKTDEQVSWILGKLPPQAQQQVALSFIPNSNQSDLLMTRYLVYDHAYSMNECVQINTQSQVLIKPLTPPLLHIRTKSNTLAVGRKIIYQVELENPNPIDLAYSITGKIDPDMWYQERQTTEGILHGTQIQTTIPLQINVLSNGNIVVKHRGRITMNLPAQSRLLFDIPLQSKAMSEQVLQVVAANLTSQFSVAEVQMKVMSHHELIETKQQVKTIIYQ